ncbi:X-X-X-Leu-X-X-Gly heptad repeat-containing protein [Caldalkalibacillus mannanilyticus]|uniref:X-X-X-Leu-X-X-Gly heptad repeat-containing protein n=1 Tax=Caldalkalibacillus mannanilyticus TaxID=1418 RepID=UPI000550A50E|nr:X-X-X-Leu-X-X-Gly heptad repeat-containing protein [Caldalkalibacillus mannanilyticus]
MTKKIVLVFIVSLLAFPLYIGNAQQNLGIQDSTDEEQGDPHSEGEAASKDEVVYGKLSPTGELRELYVVNMFNVTTSGTFLDHGNYTSIRNLTDLTEMEQEGDQVQFQASPGWFYYQGNMNDAVLPWNVEITYRLDGEKISPENLSGKEGRLLLSIQTSKNAKVDPVFYENYTMQISLTLDTDIISNIEAPEATIANVGKKKQVTYTIMPENDGAIHLLADVVKFEMEGIDIAAIPLSMSIDNPDIGEMKDEMRSLSEAIAEINKGVIDLKTGVSELNEGIQQLNNGSKEYNLRMTEIKEASSEINKGSKTIHESLVLLSEKLNGASSEKMDLKQLSQLQGGLALIADGLIEIADGLSLLQKNFSTAYTTLDGAMNGIPAPSVTEEEIQQLYASGANQEIIKRLVEVYGAAQKAKSTYEHTKQAFKAVDTTLGRTSDALYDMNNNVTIISRDLSTALEGMEGLDALRELEEGINLLATNYNEFHSGLVSYTTGVSQLADAYNEFHSGFNEMASGTIQLENGVGELANGTQELANATKDLPDKMQEEIATMMENYNYSDFEAVSFVSPKNNNIQSVQFILKTEEIKIQVEDKIDDAEEEISGFWQRLFGLFSKFKK